MNDLAQQIYPPRRFYKGSRIQKWGDLAWAMEHNTHLFVGDDLMPVSAIQQMTFLGIQRVLLEGILYVADER